MQKESLYSFHEFQSIHPDKIVRQTRIFRRKEKEDGTGHELVSLSRGGGKKIERQFHNFKISKNSAKNVREKCLWLFRLAKSRTITTYSGQQIYNFRCGFYTFTLPSEQKHPTSEILKECWERMITQFRNVLKMENYVWKLEFQKNGNVHFHLVTDTYIDYHYSRRAWNKIIERLGYVSAYAEKFSKMNFSEYRSQFNSSTDSDIKKQASWFAQGKRTNWQNPNSVDVRQCNSEKAFSYYMSKYVAKSSDVCGNSEFDSEENGFALRLCFWSRSLSRCKAISLPVDFFDFDIADFWEDFKGFTKNIFDYCTCYYYNLRECSNSAKEYFYQYFGKLRHEFLFTPA